MLTWVQTQRRRAGVETDHARDAGLVGGERYANYLDLSFEERVALTVEGMRGHLSGPGRLGNIEVTDEGDRVVVAFDPCGRVGARAAATRSGASRRRCERPESGSRTEAHDWTWGERRCLPVLLALLADQRDAADRAAGLPDAGHGVPEDPADKCRWIALPRPARTIPAEAYERVGKTKPTPDQARSEWADLRAADS